MGEHETTAALAAQLDEIRAELAGVQTAVAALRARLDTETGPVMVLQTSVKQLGEKLDQVAAELSAAIGSGEVGAVTVPRWDGAEPAAEAAQLTALAAWVNGWLIFQYPGPVRKAIKPCWPNHQEARWELGFLWARWTVLWGPDADAPGLDEAQWWAERWLPGALHRLQETAAACDSGGCKALPQQDRPNPAFTTAGMDPLTAATFGGSNRN